MGAPTTATAFGEVLREYRQRAELSQEGLALAAGIDRTYVSLLERGLRQPTLDMVFKLANELDVAPATLVAKVASRVG